MLVRSEVWLLLTCGHNPGVVQHLPRSLKAAAGHRLVGRVTCRSSQVLRLVQMHSSNGGSGQGQRLLLDDEIVPWSFIVLVDNLPSGWIGAGATVGISEALQRTFLKRNSGYLARIPSTGIDQGGSSRKDDSCRVGSSSMHGLGQAWLLDEDFRVRSCPSIGLGQRDVPGAGSGKSKQIFEKGESIFKVINFISYFKNLRIRRNKNFISFEERRESFSMEAKGNSFNTRRQCELLQQHTLFL